MLLLLTLFVCSYFFRAASFIERLALLVAHHS